VNEHDLKVFLEALHQTAEFTRIKSKFDVVVADPADDTILRTAVGGKADCVVSGDKLFLL